jgi:hypothetical protein
LSEDGLAKIRLRSDTSDKTIFIDCLKSNSHIYILLCVFMLYKDKDKYQAAKYFHEKV